MQLPDSGRVFEGAHSAIWFSGGGLRPAADRSQAELPVVFREQRNYPVAPGKLELRDGVGVVSEGRGLSVVGSFALVGRVGKKRTYAYPTEVTLDRAVRRA